MNRKNLTLLTFLVLLAASPAWGIVAYTGSLSTPTGVLGNGIWADNFKISWEIYKFSDTSWHYQYWLTELDGSALDPGAVSHWTVEVSPDVGTSDFWGFDGGWQLGSWSEAPWLTYGLKLDYGAEGQTLWDFYSTRAPVWGDFYAKDGQAGQEGLNEAWNAGYLDPDPLNPPSNGSIGNKILRPDTETEIIPEPATLSLLGLGLIGLGLARRRK